MGSEGTVTIRAVDQAEGRRILDEAARKSFDLSADEFIARWDEGDIDDLDHAAAMRVAMLIPLAG